MALVYRINSNFGFVLNTLYCKCMTNMKRFVTEHNVMRYCNQVGANERINYEPFKQMLKFRQDEAQKCILVKLPHMNHVSEFEKFCKHYATLVNIFPYRTAGNNNFVLIELQSVEDVLRFRDIAAFKTDIESAGSVTPLFLFKSRNKFCLNEPRKNISIYSNFTAPMPNEISKLLEPVDSASEQMMSLYNSLKITDLDIRLRFYTAHQISYYLSRLFHNVCVVPFGSSVNGFGQRGCDLDLLCKTSTIINKKSNLKKFLFMTQNIALAERKQQKEFLEAVGTLMEICIPGISNIRKILEARVPIIKFCNLHTNMKCDLSSTNTIALYMSELLYMYGQLDWRIKPLVCTIRKWARVMNVTKEYPGHWITNFSLTLLIIFYLQTKAILPSVNTIMCFVDLSKSNSRATDPNFDWFTSWKNSIKRTNDESLYCLLFNFFEYYSVFDFKTQAICIRDGISTQKMNSSPLYIHNPFDKTLNVSKNVTSLELMRLVESFQKAYHAMMHTGEKDIILKLIKLKTTKTNCGFNNQETQIGLEGQLFPTVTNINSMKKMQENITK